MKHPPTRRRSSGEDRQKAMLRRMMRGDKDAPMNPTSKMVIVRSHGRRPTVEDLQPTIPCNRASQPSRSLQMI